jgi:hypothetical protein
LRILRYPSIGEPQFLGCAAAFVDSLEGELNAAALALRRLEGRAKGSAFAYEMTLDQHRYGALIVLDRWSALVAAFGPHLHLAARPEMVAEAPARVAAAERILGPANQLIDAADGYTASVVEACLLAFQSASGVFQQERASAEQSAKLGPMLPEDFREARRIFSEDLAAR